MMDLIEENHDLQGSLYHMVGCFKLPVEDWQLNRMSNTSNEIRNSENNSNFQNQNLKHITKNLY